MILLMLRKIWKIENQWRIPKGKVLPQICLVLQIMFTLMMDFWSLNFRQRKWPLKSILNRRKFIDFERWENKKNMGLECSLKGKLLENDLLTERTKLNKTFTSTISIHWNVQKSKTDAMSYIMLAIFAYFWTLHNQAHLRLRALLRPNFKLKF